MTALQIQLATLLITELVKMGQRLAKVGDMTDEQCLAVIPVVQQNIDNNDDIIKNL